MVSKTENKLSHINNNGDANMVDVSTKEITKRIATAQSVLLMQQETALAIKENLSKKGDVLAVSRIAGIQAAKQTSSLIPLCHILSLSKVEINFKFIDDANKLARLQITSQCITIGQTGVEMEALTAVSIAALTVYDMCKAIDKGMIIESTMLVQKSGGNSGDFSR
jgi:cyclic pyranopterin phosphate synthase